MPIAKINTSQMQAPPPPPPPPKFGTHISTLRYNLLMCEHARGRLVGWSVADVMHCENWIPDQLPHAKAFSNHHGLALPNPTLWCAPHNVKPRTVMFVLPPSFVVLTAIA